MKKFIISIVFIIFISLSTLIVTANDDLKPVRVAISDTNFITYTYSELEFNNASELEVLDTQSGKMYSGKYFDDILKIKIKDNKFELSTGHSAMSFPLANALSIRSKSGHYIEIKGLTRAGKQAKYRGILELAKTPDNSKFYCINVLELESYLRGVVPNEMPVRFGLEALKAQSVAARNYVIAKKMSGENTKYDVSDSVASQVYYGAGSEKELSDKAVTETSGIIALSLDEEPILALYSSTAGGYSESYENAFSDINTKEFPAIPKHYLKGKPDNPEYSDLSSEDKVINFYSTFPDTFDNDSPYFRWTREWTEREMNNVLRQTVKDISSTGFITPKLESPDDFGTLENIKVVRRGMSGKAMFVEIETDKNIFLLSKELMIRRCFKNSGKALPSANFYIERTEDGGYRFIGGGYGHGVGMSQWGAGKMASLGYTYDKILNHYYTNIRLTTCPEFLRSNGELKRQIFYSNMPKAYVFIEHDNETDKLFLTVNGENLEIDLAKMPKKVKVDISDYVEQGFNEIQYFTLVDSSISPKSKLKVYTEIKGNGDV